MIVIGLTGLKGAGKSEIARRLRLHHHFERARFAGALKEMFRAFLLYRGIHPNDIERAIEGDWKETDLHFLGGKSPRFFMQRLGTEFGRDLIDPNLWVDSEVDRIRALAGSSTRREPPRFVFEDVRFPNEVEAIRRLGGSIWEVQRPGLTRSEHESEQLQTTPDVVLHNNGPISYLFAQVDAFIWGEATNPRAVA